MHLEIRTSIEIIPPKISCFSGGICKKRQIKERGKTADIFHGVYIKFVKRFKICKSLVQYLQIVVKLKYGVH